MEKWENVQTKDDDKFTHTTNPITSMIFGGRFPSTSEMAINQYGEFTAGSSEAVDSDLTMSSLDWQKKGLPSMGKNLKNVSLRGEDLSADLQATKAKQTFLDMPREVLNKLTDEVYTIVSEYFAVEHFSIPNTDKQNQYAKLMRIQSLAVAIQTRIVILEDRLNKLVRRTCKQRPSDLDEIRRQEIGLRTQTPLL
jgi:hypothetical protein